MKTIEISGIQMTGTDAQGKYAMAEVDGEWVGVSLAGEDELVRDLSEIEVGAKVEAGAETMRVVAKGLSSVSAGPLTAAQARRASAEIAAMLPSRLDDGTGTLRTIVESALRDGTISVFDSPAEIESGVAAIVAQAIVDAREG